MHRLFVYGSLKFGLSNHRRLGGAPCLDRDARTVRHGLVRYFAGYPALVEAPGRTARGELYSVSDETLAALDEFEECPQVYVRKQVLLILSDGTQVEAFAYLAAQSEATEPHSGEAWQPPPGLIPFEER